MGPGKARAMNGTSLVTSINNLGSTANTINNTFGPADQMRNGDFSTNMRASSVLLSKSCTQMPIVVRERATSPKGSSTATDPFN
jgi:hypothetical protein